MSLEPLAKDSACVDAAQECLEEARTRKLYDPLDSISREQEELISHRACLVRVRECRARAWADK